MKTVSLKLPEHLDARLSSIARRRGAPRKSALIREAVERFVDAESETRAGSLLDSLADLCGSLEGHADLTTNPKYREGFGRDRIGHRGHRSAGRLSRQK